MKTKIAALLIGLGAQYCSTNTQLRDKNSINYQIPQRAQYQDSTINEIELPKEEIFIPHFPMPRMNIIPQYLVCIEKPENNPGFFQNAVLECEVIEKYDISKRLASGYFRL